MLPHAAKVFCHACIHTTVLGFSLSPSSICAWYARDGGLRRGFKLRCLASNPHRLVAASRRIGTRRGFLPRGLYDAHPSLVIATPLARLRGWASYKPKLERALADFGSNDRIGRDLSFRPQALAGAAPPG